MILVVVVIVVIVLIVVFVVAIVVIEVIVVIDDAKIKSDSLSHLMTDKVTYWAVLDS